jgi:cellulose biosynthesis protein BcsQ
MKYCNLKQVLQTIPDNAQKALVSSMFIPELLKNLGYDITEIVPKFLTGNGGDSVDCAIRRNTSDDIFVHTKLNPNLLIELTGRDVNLSKDSNQYNLVVYQLKRYLLAPRCQSAQWGIITNSNHIQLFRRHGKVIHPALSCMEMRLDNLDEVIGAIKTKIDKLQKALTITIYNNKGGVGKTTTTINLAATLSLLGKTSLIVDFDPNQHDLTNGLGLKLSENSMYDWLENKNLHSTKELITRCNFANQSNNNVLQFDVIASDKKLNNCDDIDLRPYLKIHRLRQALEPLKFHYDYVLIDSPPNWRFFSQSAVYAADVVLIPTKHNNIFSLENAAIFLKNFLPDIKEERKTKDPKDGGLIALPIFFNGEQITEAQKLSVEQAIDNIIDQAKKDKNKPLNLTPYFYPKYTSANQNRYIFNLPKYAHIANSAFARIPAVYKNSTAREYYLALAKEYFLQ